MMDRQTDTISPVTALMRETRKVFQNAKLSHELSMNFVRMSLDIKTQGSNNHICTTGMGNVT
jgi:hypothetical protein